MCDAMDPGSDTGSGSATRNECVEQRLAAWFRTPRGHRLLAAERQPTGDAVRHFHGDAMLWLGATPLLLDTVSRCMVRLAIHARRRPCGRGAGDVRVVAGDAGELPLAAASVDGIVLHHVLESVADPRRVLREATRVLRPGGRLLVAGFNPLSLWAVAKPHRALRGLKPVSALRLYDWLAVLGFERAARTVYVNYRAALPFAFGGERWRRASSWLNKRQPPIGGVYLVVATKVGHGYIVEQKQLRRVERRLVSPLPAPATRQAA